LIVVLNLVEFIEFFIAKIFLFLDLKMKKNFLLEIKYGILISIFTILWLTFEQLSGLQDEYIELHKIVSSFSIIVPIIGIWFAISERKMSTSKYSFEKGFKTGFIITLINTVLIIPIIYLFYTFINPDFAINMMSYAKSQALHSGEDHLKAIEDARSYFSMNYYMIQKVVETFIFGSLISSVIAFVQKNRKSRRSWS
jgi:hypothetical protein